MTFIQVKFYLLMSIFCAIIKSSFKSCDLDPQTILMVQVCIHEIYIQTIRQYCWEPALILLNSKIKNKFDFEYLHSLCYCHNNSVVTGLGGSHWTKLKEKHTVINTAYISNHCQIEIIEYKRTVQRQKQPCLGLYLRENNLPINSLPS